MSILIVTDPDDQLLNLDNFVRLYVDEERVVGVPVTGERVTVAACESNDEAKKVLAQLIEMLEPEAPHFMRSLIGAVRMTEGR